MPIPARLKRTIRLWINIDAAESVEEVIAGTLVAFNRAGLEVQVAFGHGPQSAGQLADVSQFNSLLLKIWTTAAEYLDVEADYVDSALTLEEWNARTSVRSTREKAAHAIFTITSDEFSFELGTSDALALKVTIHGDTTDEAGDDDAWTRTNLIVLNSGLAATAGTRAASNLIPGGAVYDGSGEYTLTGLTVGRGYRWTDGGANDTNVVNTAETITTSNAVFWAQATSVVLHGTIGAAVTAVVWYPATFTADELAAYLQSYGGSTFEFLWLKSKDSSLYYKVRVAENNGVATLNVDETSGTATP